MTPILLSRERFSPYGLQTPSHQKLQRSFALLASTPVRSAPPSQQACRVAVEDRSAGFSLAKRRVRQLTHSRYCDSAPQTHLRELVA